MRGLITIKGGFAMKKRGAWILVVVLCSFLLVSVSWAQDAIEITFWHHEAPAHRWQLSRKLSISL